jgi:tetratricopeptide (TPR) repeat protein
MKFDQPEGRKQISPVVSDLATTLTTLEELAGPNSPKLLPVLRSLSALSSIDDAIVYDARIRSILRQTDTAALKQNLAVSIARYAASSSHDRHALSLYDEFVSLGEQPSPDFKLQAACIYRNNGQLDKAEALIVEAMTQLPESPDKPGSLQPFWAQLASIRQRLGNIDGAIAAQQAFLDCLEKQIGTDNPALISSIDYLLNLQRIGGRTDEALTLRRRALKERLDGNGCAC